MNSRITAYAPLTKRELQECFESYRNAFPAWNVEHDVMLTRKHGPLRQAIYLESLRYAAYRPAHSVDLLFNIPDGCTILHQQLDVKHREVERRQHRTKWPLVLKAMEEQFQPSIRKPLDMAETLLLAEDEVERNRIDNINYSTGLAALNAYLGNRDRALYWCRRIEEAATNMGRPVGDWEIRKRRYALELKQAVKAGTAREFLSTA